MGITITVAVLVTVAAVMAALTIRLLARRVGGLHRLLSIDAVPTALQSWRLIGWLHAGTLVAIAAGVGYVLFGIGWLWWVAFN